MPNPSARRPAGASSCGCWPPAPPCRTCALSGEVDDPPRARPGAGSARAAPRGELIASPEEALTVFDFEAVAKEKLHYGHVAFLGGTEDEARRTARTREGFTKYQLRGPAPGRHQPHRHVGVALRVERALPGDPPLPLRRAQRLPPGRWRGGGGPRL